MWEIVSRFQLKFRMDSSVEPSFLLILADGLGFFLGSRLFLGLRTIGISLDVVPL